MNKNITFLLIVSLALSLLVACKTLNSVSENKNIAKDFVHSENDFSVKSPNRLFELVIKDSSAKIAFGIFDSDKKLLFSRNTDMYSTYKWTAKWYGNDRFVIDSSDVGATEWKLQKDGKWISGNPYLITSPDGNTILSTNWSDEKYFTIAFVKKCDDGSLELLNEIKTGLEVKDLIDCVSWNGNNQIILKSDNIKYIWEKSKDGTWNILKK